MIEIFEYLQHFQRQVEIFKGHVNTGISSSHNTGFAECLHPDFDVRNIPKGTDIIAKINSVLFTKYNYHPTKDEFEQIKNYIKEHKHSSTH